MQSVHIVLDRKLPSDSVVPFVFVFFVFEVNPVCTYMEMICVKPKKMNWVPSTNQTCFLPSCNLGQS